MPSTNHANRSRNHPSRNPTPDEIRAAREAAVLTQTDAGLLVHTPLRTWQQWEAAEGTEAHRRMHPAIFELFLLKTNQKKLKA